MDGVLHIYSHVYKHEVELNTPAPQPFSFTFLGGLINMIADNILGGTFNIDVPSLAPQHPKYNKKCGNTHLCQSQTTVIQTCMLTNTVTLNYFRLNP